MSYPYQQPSGYGQQQPPQPYPGSSPYQQQIGFQQGGYPQQQYPTQQYSTGPQLYPTGQQPYTPQQSGGYQLQPQYPTPPQPFSQPQPFSHGHGHDHHHDRHDRHEERYEERHDYKKMLLRVRAHKHMTLSAEENGTARNGGHVWLWDIVDRHGNHNQQWIYEKHTGLIYLAAHPERVLSTEAGHHNGTKVWFWERVGSSGNENQKWELTSDGYVAIRANPRQVLSLVDRHDNGGTVHLWERVGHGHENQIWHADTI